MIILWTVLKVIGILFLILAILVSIILFVPVSYEVYGNIEEKDYRIRISWLWHLISARLQYCAGTVHVLLRILFFRIDLTDPEKKEKREQRKKRRQRRRAQKKLRKRKKRRKKEQKRNQKKWEKNRRGVELDPEEAKAEPESDAVPDKIISAQSVSDSITSGTDSRIKTLFAAVRKWGGILKDIYESGIVRALMPKLQIFLIRIRPRKLQGHLEFGLEDPASTGQILGGISMLPFLFRTDLEIVPDFETEKNYICGNIEMKGRIYGIHILIFGIQIWRNPQIRAMLKIKRK